MPFWKCFPCLRLPSEENITILDYSNGTLTDIPPDVSQFERTLEELYLSSNRISDLPPELFYCQGIRVLKLNDNELETIPNAIGSLRQLQQLDLSRNALTYIPDNIKSCKHLTHLDLSLNSLQRLPDAITNLISLQELLLNETYLEFLPANFGRLVNLKILELRSNNLITLPKSMARLTNLSRIDIGANEFTELPEVIGQLTQLKELWIDNNRIRRISANISNLRELIHFEANNNHLTHLPSEISHWRKLEVMSLSSNELEDLPFSIGMLKRLVTLTCDYNQLRELPDSICHLESLEEMVVNHNNIMRLPNTIGLLRKLRFLAADENLLHRLPDEICSCIGLTTLSLRRNKLVELPLYIGHLVNLRVINVVDNCIQYLPVSVLSLSKLTALWLSDNQSQPVVQLQYVNSSAKPHLTCFMLPQTNRATKNRHEQENKLEYKTSTLSPEYSDNGSANSWIPLQQLNKDQNIENQSKHQQTNPNLQISSPSRRICFADESGARSTEPITTCLMRSPTPYPKELRLMAKCVKTMNQNYLMRANNVQMVAPKADEVNGGAFSNDAQTNLRIKEARVLSKPGGVILHNSTENYDDTALPTSNNATNCDMPSAQRNFYNTLTTADSSPNNYINLHQNPIISSSSYDTYDGQMPTSVNPIPSLSMQHQSNYTTIEYSNDYNQLPIFSNSLPGQESHNWSKTTQKFVMADLSYPDEQQSNHSLSLLQAQKPDHIQRQPPPYHIAKVFTKKSREDLLNYDSIRNQSDPGNNSIHDNEFEDGRPVLCDDNFNSNFSQQNGDCSEISYSMNNNNNENNNNAGVEQEPNDCMDTNMTAHSDYLSRSPVSNLASSSEIISNSPELANGHIDEQNSQQLDQGSNPYSKTLPKQSSQWLFGLHRNPTVKQLIIKKDHILGFEIKEIQNQGIFVNLVIPDTPAYSLLRVDDKILDVDGFDFTKVTMDEARQVLIDSGPILNIMISRR